MEKAGDVGAGTQGCHHEAQLGNRRVSQDPFDVPLRHGDQRGKECCEGADARHKLHAGGCHLPGCVKDRKHSHQQKDPGRNHGRRMDQGTDRGRAFHCIGQPDMQRELRAFSDGAEEDQDRDQGDRRCRNVQQRDSHNHRSQVFHVGWCQDLFEDQRVVEAPHVKQQHACKEDRVADSGGHKGFECSFFGRLFFEPEANQQIAAQPHDLPEDEEGEQRVGDNKSEHTGGKEADIGHEPAVAWVASLRVGVRIVFLAQVGGEGHVARCIDEDHEQQKCDHEDHQRVGWVDLKADQKISVAGRQGKQLPVQRVLPEVGGCKDSQCDRPA